MSRLLVNRTTNLGRNYEDEKIHRETTDPDPDPYLNLRSQSPTLVHGGTKMPPRCRPTPTLARSLCPCCRDSQPGSSATSYARHEGFMNLHGIPCRLPRLSVRGKQGKPLPRSLHRPPRQADRPTHDGGGGASHVVLLYSAEYSPVVTFPSSPVFASTSR